MAKKAKRAKPRRARKTVRKAKALKVGAFYWVKVRPADEMLPASEWQPAKFTGIACDSVGETWDFIGQRSEDGHHFLDVIETGPEITRPK